MRLTLTLQRIFVQEAQNPLHPPFPKGEKGGSMHGKSLTSSAGVNPALTGNLKRNGERDDSRSPSTFPA